MSVLYIIYRIEPCKVVISCRETHQVRTKAFNTYYQLQDEMQKRIF